MADGFGCREGDAVFAEDAGGDRVADAEHAEQHVFVAKRTLAGTVSGVLECLFQTG